MYVWHFQVFPASPHARECGLETQIGFRAFYQMFSVFLELLYSNLKFYEKKK